MKMIFLEFFGEIIHQTSPQLNNTLAIRSDGHSAFGEQFSFRISSAYELSKNANLKGSYGTGFGHLPFMNFMTVVMAMLT